MEARTLPRGSAGARQLAQDLRKPLPEGFRWDFSMFLTTDGVNKKCGCAIGYIQEFYPNALVSFERGMALAVAKYFNMPFDTASDIFLRHYTYPVFAEADVTPKMVADRIDEWLSSNGHPTSRD